MHLRTILQGIKMQVIAHQICIAESSQAFDSQGALAEPSLDQSTRLLGRQVCQQLE